MDACEYATYLAAGFQMVALNMQTADEATQYQHAFFEQNGACGYVLPRPLAPPGRGMALEVRPMGAWLSPKPDEGRVDEADPPPWRGMPKARHAGSDPGGARRGRHHRDSLRRRRRLRMCDAQAHSELPKSRRGSAEPKSRSGSVDNGGGVGRRGTVGFSGRRGSGAGLAPATAPAAAPAPASDEEEAAEKALLAQHRHLWCSSVVYGNGFLAAWHGSDNRGEKAVLLARIAALGRRASHLRVRVPHGAVRA